MQKTGFASVDDYIASFPAATQDALRTVRAAIRESVPEAEEAISYQIPAYKLNHWVIYFGGFKNHYSLFCPHSEVLFEAFKDELAGLDVSQSKIRLPLDQPVPSDLIGRMARFSADRSGAQPRQMVSA